MDAAVVGREVELSAADDFLSAIAEGFAALALEGEPGIGKTTLWREAIRRARARGFRVLACRPAQSEAKLSFAGLGDPLGPVPADVFDALPEPQRRALDVALLQVDAGSASPDQRAVAASFLAVVRALATSCPLLIAVDDTQWVDSPSAAVLEFTVRRLDVEPVGLLTVYG